MEKEYQFKLVEGQFTPSEAGKVLFSLINNTKKSGVILISGDIHSGQILMTPCILPGITYR